MFWVERGRSEAEAEVVRDCGLFLLWECGNQVLWISFNVDGVYRADVLTATAAKTELCVDLWVGKTIFPRYHVYSLGRAVLSAGAAAGALVVNDADVSAEYYMARLNLMLLFKCNVLDCTCRADV